MEFRPMSPEEVERTVQLLLSHQAQFAADLERLAIKTDGVAEAVLGLTGIVGRVADGIGQLTAWHGELARAHGEVARAHAALADKVRQLAEAQERTDARLNIVIEMFERHLREGSGPRPS